jgi:hypothetical protein
MSDNPSVSVSPPSSVPLYVSLGRKLVTLDLLGDTLSDCISIMIGLGVVFKKIGEAEHVYDESDLASVAIFAGHVANHVADKIESLILPDERWTEDIIESYGQVSAETLAAREAAKDEEQVTFRARRVAEKAIADAMKAEKKGGSK